MKTSLKRLAILLLLIATLIPLQLSWAGQGSHDVDASRPILVIGDDINYPPYSYLDKNGQPAGFNIELARYVANAMGYNAVFRLEEWSQVRNDLESGKIDLISGMFFSPDRNMLYGFTTKHSITSGDIFTQKGVSLKDISELKDKTVVVQKGDIVGEYLATRQLNIHLVEVPTVNEALTLVKNGKYEYAGLLKLPGLYGMKEQSFNTIRAQGLVLAPNNYCMAVKKGNDTLLMTLNGGMNIAKATGDYQKIYDKWLGVYQEKSLLEAIRPYSKFILITLLALLFLGTWVVVLRHVVAIKTKELLDANKHLQHQQEELTAANEEMEASMEELMAIEEELREQYERLANSEKNLQISEERSKAIIHALPDILFILNDEGVFIDCQASSTAELLLPPELFIGKKIHEVMPPEIADTGLRKIQLAISTGELQSMEYTIPSNGKLDYYELRIVKSQLNEAIGITRNITAQKSYQQRIEFLSYHDQLTGLYNRRYFEEELQRLDQENQLPLGIVMADVNGLKLINDSFGHQVGDQLLMKVADVMKQACTGSETVSRIGGDEFVILLPRMTEDQAEDLIRLIKVISDREKVASVSLSISFGWEAKISADENIQEVFNRAEDYMYKKKLFEGPSMRGKTIGAIINTLHEKNFREEQHSQRVSDLCRRLAEELSLSERDIEEIKNAGLLHDIGKIAIHEYLLNKPGKLTPDELEEVRRHPEIGYRILSSVNDMSELADCILAHHERWDGQGYPRGLARESIPLHARMIGIADAYDAMTSERTYKQALSDQQAVEELIRHAGTQFDPDLIRPFVEGVLGFPAGSVPQNLVQSSSVYMDITLDTAE